MATTNAAKRATLTCPAAQPIHQAIHQHEQANGRSANYQHHLPSERSHQFLQSCPAAGRRLLPVSVSPPEWFVNVRRMLWIHNIRLSTFGEGNLPGGRIRPQSSARTLFKSPQIASQRTGFSPICQFWRFPPHRRFPLRLLRRRTKTAAAARFRRPCHYTGPQQESNHSKNLPRGPPCCFVRRWHGTHNNCKPVFGQSTSSGNWGPPSRNDHRW